MPLSDIMNSAVVTIAAEASIKEAASLMKEQHVGDIIVVDERLGRRKPIGILTDRDIVTFVVAEGLIPDDIEVADVMATEPETANEDDGLFEVCRQMCDAGIRRLPVTDDQGDLMGIVSIDDLYQLLALELNNLASVSTAQINREQTGEAVLERFS